MSLLIESMHTVSDIRRTNLELLIAEFGSSDEVARRGRTAAVYISQLRNSAADSKTGKPRVMGDPLARKLEAGCGKERGWMDHEHAHPSYRQKRILETNLVMENMEDWQFDQAVKIIDTIAQPAPKRGNGENKG